MPLCTDSEGNQVAKFYTNKNSRVCVCVYVRAYVRTVYDGNELNLW